MSTYERFDNLVRRAGGRSIGAVTLAVALGLGAMLAWLAAQAGMASGSLWRSGAVVMVAAALGLALSHAAFGFTQGYRQLLRDRLTGQVRAQLLLLGVAVILFQPVLAAGEAFGQPVRGFVFPVGVELVVGAFLFGLGMQIAGACGSGTLYALGGGSLRMALALAGLVGGATLAAVTASQWSGLPRLAPVSLPDAFGLLPALIVQLALIGWLWLWLARLERRHHGAVASVWQVPDQGLLGGRWPFAWGAVAIALLAFVALLLLGRPWGIMQAFALWGSRAVEVLALGDPYFWVFWEHPNRVELLARPILADAMSVMNVAIVLGAMAAAALGGRFALRWRLSRSEAMTALAGGVLMGFGGIIATGCNISALVSGVASGSLHGWVWLAAALPGNWLGVWLRPRLGLHG